MKTINTMKTNRKIILAAFMAIAIVGCVNAQKEGKYTIKSAKKIILENFHNDLEVKGHDSKDIVIKCSDYEEPPARAEGLKPVYSSGVDNTGVGVFAKEEDGVVILKPASKISSDADHEILIPRNMNVKIEFSNPWADDVEVENIAGEIEISALSGNIELNEIIGPVVINSINGDVEADFSSFSKEGPSSIECINGEIELKMPANISADVLMKTLNGDIYSNFDLEMKKKEDMKHIGGSEVSGKINGGGVSLKLHTINGKIYLRKK